MGAPTFGKGSVQTVIELAPDMGLKLTIARYYTPSGRSIQDRGVQPDILLDDFDPKVLADARRKQDLIREKDLKGHMVNPDGDEGAPSRPEYKKEELEASLKKKSDKSPDKADEDGPPKFNAKEDYQVREALNHLKSFELYKRIVASESAVEAVPAAATSSPLKADNASRSPSAAH